MKLKLENQNTETAMYFEKECRRSENVFLCGDTKAWQQFGLGGEKQF